MPLFDVVVIEQPTKKQREEGALEIIVKTPCVKVAKDEKQAAMQAILSLTDEEKAKIALDRVEVVVRPF